MSRSISKPTTTPRNCINPLRCRVVDNRGNLPWRSHLKKYGWVIVNESTFSNLNLPIEEWIRQMRDWIVTFGPTSYGTELQEPTEEEVEQEPWLNWQQHDIPGSNKKSGYVSTNAGHTNFMWDARLRVKPVFDEIWNVGKNKYGYDLVTSFEGFTYCVRQATESRQCLSFSHPEGLDEMICIRSFISLSDTTQQESGGIILVDQSHNDYDKYINTSGRPGRALVSLWANDPNRFIRPALKPGDILLFDSKVVSDTFGPSSYRLPFIGMWITMLPDDMMDERSMDYRIQMFMTKKQSNPWCYGELMAISVDSDAHPFRTHTTDADGNIVVNGITISKTNYSDVHAKLVVPTTLESIRHRYEMIKSSHNIKMGRQPSRSGRGKPSSRGRRRGTPSNRS